MNDVAVALAVHLIAIGGVSMVTTTLLPTVQDIKLPEERLALFSAVERRFARQARWATLLTGVSGFYMVERLELWTDFFRPESWWLGAMTLVWALFTVILFVAEPLFLERWFEHQARLAPERTFALVQCLHWGLLILSLLTIAGAAAGSHGLSFVQ
jgi:uncharacterized membrane protein